MAALPPDPFRCRRLHKEVVGICKVCGSSGKFNHWDDDLFGLACDADARALRVAEFSLALAGISGLPSSDDSEDGRPGSDDFVGV